MSVEKIDGIVKQMQSSDYDHLLSVVFQYFDTEPSEYGDEE